MENIICQTCLSKNRRLIPIGRVRYLMQELFNLKMKEDHGICWECHHVLLKSFKFKAQVCKAQELIKCMGEKSQCLSKLSSTAKNHYDYQFTFHTDPLTSELDIKIDIKTEYDFDACENSNDESKYGVNEITVDTKPSINDEAAELVIELEPKQLSFTASDDDEVDNTEHDFNNKDVIGTNADTISKNKVVKERDKIIKKTKSKYRKVNNETNKDVAELKSKFSIIKYSEEEMQKHREAKRSQPNFKKVPFKCDSCVLGFVRKENFDAHMVKKHNQNHPYMCDVCLTRFHHKRHMSRHIDTHYASYRCRFCPYQTREMWSALNHCRVKHTTDMEGCIHCPQCGVETKTQEDLSEHIESQHSLYCDECGEKFKAKSTLRTHKARIHSVKREFVCEICRKTFKTQSRLESHVVTHNDAIAKKLSYCSTCNMQFKNITVYRCHLKNSANHAERLYPCPECDKKFASRVYRNKHYNFYHKQKSKFICDICSKIFISNYALNHHMQTQHEHARTRDHPCNVCGKKFFTPGILRSHQFTHSTQRTFMCEDCGVTFKQRAALYNHTKLVHRRKTETL